MPPTVTADRLRALWLALPGSSKTFPFNPETSVFKVGGKMFALAPLGAAVLTVSVKCDPEVGEGLTSTHDSIVGGYHLNKRHWITVTLGGDAGDDLVEQLVEDSYDLVRPKPKR